MNDSVRYALLGIICLFAGGCSLRFGTVAIGSLFEPTDLKWWQEAICWFLFLFGTYSTADFAREIVKGKQP